MRPSALPTAGAGGTTGAAAAQFVLPQGHSTGDNDTPNSTSSSSYANLDSTAPLATARVLSPRRYTIRSITPSPVLYPLASPQSFATDSAFDAEYHTSKPKTRPATSATRTKVTLFSRRHIGLLVSLAFASVLTSCIKRGLLPLLKSELKMSQTQLDAAQVLVILPWASSFFLGFCSDAIPIFGCHRKSYMVLGWLVASASLFVLSIVNYAQEYDTRIKNGDATLNSEDRIQVLDLYVALLGLASFGGILSVVVAEIYVIQQSRREPLRYRGHIVATFLITQFSCEMVGQMATDLVIFRVTRLGSFPLFTFRNLLFFFVVYALVPIPMLICFFDERVGDPDERQVELESGERKARKGVHHGVADDDDDDDDYIEDGVDLAASAVPVLGGVGGGYSDDEDRHRATDQYDKAPHSKRRCPCSLFTSLKVHAKTLWRTLRRDSTWRIVRFLGFFIFFSEFTLEYPMQMIERWCRMTLKFESSGKILSEAMYAIAVFAWKLVCMDTDWRVLMGGTLVGVYMLPQAVYFFLAIYGIGRSGETYVMFSMLKGFIRGMIVVIQVALAVEITPRGSEGATLGLVVSIGTVMRLMANTYSNILGNWLTSGGSKNGDISGTSSSSSDSDDTRAIRNHVASALGVCFFMRLIALFGLKFLPKQKRELQALLRAETPSLGSAISVLATLLGSLAFVAVVNVWIVTPEAACARSGECKSAADTVVG